MTHYFTSKWSSLVSRAVAHEEPTHSHRTDNHKSIVEQLKSRGSSAFEHAASELPTDDPFRCLLTRKHNDLRDEILLRFLQFNNFDLDKTIRQLQSTLTWRAQTRISSADLSVIRGSASGIPLARIGNTTEKGDTLFFAAAECYDKSLIDRAVQKVGVARMFEHMLYDRGGPRAKRGTVVVDFSGFGTKHVDISGLRTGVTTYINHYPEVFEKVLLTNYPKLLYGVWKAIVPLLDARTARRVVWADKVEDLRDSLLETFSEKNIPTWLGGKAEVSSLTLLNGTQVQATLLAKRFFREDQICS